MLQDVLQAALVRNFFGADGKVALEGFVVFILEYRSCDELYVVRNITGPLGEQKLFFTGSGRAEYNCQFTGIFFFPVRFQQG